MVVIRIIIGIKDRIEGFLTIARLDKPPPNIVLPPDEYNGKNWHSIGGGLRSLCALVVFRRFNIVVLQAV